jgi:Protein of unknown function (DUF1194)
MRCLALALCLLLPAAATAAAEFQPVDSALVLVTDVSRSIDDKEFQLEKQGYVTAFNDPRVLAAIKAGPNGRIIFAYIEFAGADQVRTVLDWTVIDGETTAAAFGTALDSAARSFYGRTAIGSGLDQALHMLAEPQLKGARLIVDVAGDGTSNAGPPVTEIRDQAVAAGITINGLAIVNDHPESYSFAHVQPPGGLAQWYRDNVAGGPYNFVLEVHDFHTFGEAMARKLLSEIAGFARPNG